tara:strand:+ start:164 stop:454 length:291 start_codon:yes stop_codon:yes gene_type:complete
VKEEFIKLGWFIIAYLFNFGDAICTLYAVSHGHQELNPFMAWAIEVDPRFFIVVKFVIFTFAIEYIVRHAPRLLSFVAVLYTMVMTWHLFIWLNIV